MIGKITKGSDFAGLTNYILSKEKSQLLCTNLAGSTPQEFWQQLEATTLLNPNVSYPVCHTSISFAIEDTPKLSSNTLLTVVDATRKGIGLDSCLYFAATHGDRKHFHLHLAASRIDVEGNCVSDWHNFYRLEKTLRSLEEELDLKKIKCSWEVEHTAPSTGQERRKRREKEEFSQGLRQTPLTPSAVEKIQATIAISIEPGKNLNQLFADLKNENIFPRLKVNSDGQILGISYLADGVAIKGSKLGRGKGACTLAGLAYRGIILDLELGNKSITTQSLPSPLEISADTQEQPIIREAFKKRWEQTRTNRQARPKQEQMSQKQQKQEQQERHQLWGNEIAPIVLTLLDSYQADSLESNNKRYQIDRLPESCDVVVQRVDTLEPVPNHTQILGFNYSKKGLKVWHNLLTQEDVEHFQAVDQQLSDKQQQLQQQQTPQQQIWETQQENLQNSIIAEEIVPIAGAALEHTLLTTKTPEPSIDWNQYRISWNRQELELAITVSDGRGEILRASFEDDGTYHLPACSVTPEDVKNFQTLRQELQEQLPYKVPQPQKSLSNQLQRQPPSRKQIELD
ncbi:relaxase/mobilization nuclease domain-containing protein [Microcoleus sp. Pol10_D6]|uniref:relaxase/mobilization nuclease domain-containing protein n=1 Tax=Microcoleus sp. Pol10_D6 TaxID=2818875 RepID=UPI002FD2DB54